MRISTSFFFKGVKMCGDLPFRNPPVSKEKLVVAIDL